MRDSSRKVPDLSLRTLGGLLLLIGTIILIFASSLPILLAVQRTPAPSPVPTLSPSYVSPDKVPTNTAEATQTSHVAEPTEVPTPAPPPTRLVIPVLGVDAPVVEVPISDKSWDLADLTNEIAHLGGTANPGENSNMVLAGHVTLRRGTGPFLHLERLEPGNVAIVYTVENAYTYRVVGKQYVEPDDVFVAYPSEDPILTLLTCARWDAESRSYSERVAVIAELVPWDLPIDRR
jgi:LPXTG-site transpeptidase (sortase) family protein